MARQRSQPSGIGDLLDRIFQRIDPEERRGAHRIWAFWAEEVGEAVAERAEPAGFHAGVLSVRVSNHAWMQELQFLKEDLRERLNARLGRELIRDIYFVSGRAGGSRPEPAKKNPVVREVRPPVEIPPLDDPGLTEVFERLARAQAKRSP